MKRFLMFFSLLLVLLVAGGKSLHAQQVGSETWMVYNDQKKSEVGAVLIELAIPVLGHAYAGNARQGLIPFGVSVVGIALMVSSFDGYGDTNTNQLSLGYLGYLGGRIWGAVSAYQVAQGHNDALRSRLGIKVGMTNLDGDLRPTLALKIPIN